MLGLLYCLLSFFLSFFYSRNDNTMGGPRENLLPWIMSCTLVNNHCFFEYTIAP